MMGRDPSLGGTPHLRDRLEMADADELLRVRGEARAAMEQDRPYAGRIRARRADGELRLLDARADPVHDADGSAIGLRGFVQDITELARAERRQRTVAELGQAALAGLTLEALMQRDGRRHVQRVPRRGRRRARAEPRRERAGRPRRARAARHRRPVADPTPLRHARPKRALDTRQPVVIDDLDPHFPGGEHRDIGARSAAIVVIGGRGRPFGAARGDLPAAPALQPRARQLPPGPGQRPRRRRRAPDRRGRDRRALRRPRAPRRQALDAEERARRRISETLHDGALQELLAARVDLFGLTGRGGDEAAIAGAQERLGAIIRRLREVMSALHPTVLQYGGLEAALHAVADEQAGAGGFEVARRGRPRGDRRPRRAAALGRARAAHQRGPPRRRAHTCR